MYFFLDFSLPFKIPSHLLWYLQENSWCSDWATVWKVRCSNFSRNNNFFSSPKYSYRLWGPYSVYFLGLKRPEREDKHLLPYSREVLEEWSSTSTPLPLPYAFMTPDREIFTFSHVCYLSEVHPVLGRRPGGIWHTNCVYLSLLVCSLDQLLFSWSLRSACVRILTVIMCAGALSNMAGRAVSGRTYRSQWVTLSDTYNWPL